MYPRPRPHLKQRRTTRLLNFGVRCERTMIDVRAICNIGLTIKTFGKWSHLEDGDRSFLPRLLDTAKNAFPSGFC